jgi:hypothetical protein
MVTVVAVVIGMVRVVISVLVLLVELLLADRAEARRGARHHRPG